MRYRQLLPVAIIIAVLLGHLCNGELVVFMEATKTCAFGCEENGNCNGETGTCECPFGLTGPTCQERILPACHSSFNAGTLPHYGLWYPKNCECYRQLKEFGCKPHPECLYDAIWYWGTLKCYDMLNKTKEQQISDLPEDLTAPDLAWFKGVHVDTKGTVRLDPIPSPTEVLGSDENKLRSLNNCPNRCNERGWCYEDRHDNNRLKCKCHGFYEGEACEKSVDEHCPVGCSGRGVCVGSSFCYCQKGFWGHGCTRSKAYSSTKGWVPNHAQLKIYVYDLPQNVVHRKEFNDQWPLIDVMYNSESWFFDLILNDTVTRTHNPWEANMFYIPAFTYYFTGNVGGPHRIFPHIFKYVKENYPWWNLTAGRNHFVWATNDRGACELEGQPLEVQRPIKLVHFGQAPRSPYLAHGNTQAGVNPNHESEQAAVSGHRFEGFAEFNHNDIRAEAERCYRPEKDAITPCFLDYNWLQNSDAAFYKVELPGGGVQYMHNPNTTRNLLFFFGGYNKPMQAYSGGVRQAMHALFTNTGRQDVLVGPPQHGDAIRYMLTSRFCLAPTGFGWGIRLPEAMVSGCVPVIIQDHIYQAFWDILPYEEFSIRISRQDVHKLLDILDAVTPEELARLQAGVARNWRAFHWQPRYQGLAYNYTLTSLHRRLHNMWSTHFRRRAMLDGPGPMQGMQQLRGQ